jgi:hypothetical protein
MEAEVTGVTCDFALMGVEVTRQGQGRARRTRLGPHRRGRGLEERLSPAEGGNGRRGVRALRWSCRPGGRPSEVEGRSGREVPCGEDGPWAGPPPAVMEGVVRAAGDRGGLGGRPRGGGEVICVYAPGGGGLS